MWKSHTMDGLVAVEDSEEATLHYSVRGYIYHVYVLYGMRL